MDRAAGNGKGGRFAQEIVFNAKGAKERIVVDESPGLIVVCVSIEIRRNRRAGRAKELPRLPVLVDFVVSHVQNGAERIVTVIQSERDPALPTLVEIDRGVAAQELSAES